MGRLTNETYEEIDRLIEAGLTARAISKKVGVGEKSIQKKIDARFTVNLTDDAVSAGEIIKASEEEQDDTDWKAWSSFWKEKYLGLHAEMVELGHL